MTLPALWEGKRLFLEGLPILNALRQRAVVEHDRGEK
jgi:hypothetical protein